MTIFKILNAWNSKIFHRPANECVTQNVLMFMYVLKYLQKGKSTVFTVGCFIEWRFWSSGGPK